MTRTLNLRDIAEIPEFQIRTATDAATISRYAKAMQNGANFPPIKVAQVNGSYAVVDGWHRLGAARQNGEAQIEATIVPCKDIEEARWLAAEANLTHGLQLKRGARREVFRAFVRAGKHRKGRAGVKSSREIATALQGIIAHATVLEYMRSDFPAIYAKMRGSEESPRGVGGLPDQIAPDDLLTGHVGAAMEQALAAFRGVQDAAARGQIIGQLRETLKAMEGAGGWTDPPPEQDDPF